LLRYIEVCDGNMERGSLRCDVNISVRPAGQTALNERTEIKNLNSIRAVERAILAERDRQIGIYKTGGTVHRETLLWDEATEEIRAMRRKEGSDDYRYFPEPDLVMLTVAPEFIERVRGQLPELPEARRRRYRDDLQLHPEAVWALTTDRALGDYFETLLSLGVEPRAAANWMQGEVRRYLAEHAIEMSAFPVSPEDLAELVRTVQNGTLSLNQAKEVFREMATERRNAAQIISARGLGAGAAEDELRRTLEDILALHPDELARYRAGKKNLFGFFMGEAMKASQGKANPKLLNNLLTELLNAS
jgi:aspartyl-tRNA(Asn)/glutamyl-tRNA(Gln) amidotransferase subunit B